MFKSLQDLSNLKKREEGQGLVEYALILVLVAVVVIVVLSLVGPAVGNIFSEVVSALNGDTPSSDCVQYFQNGMHEDDKSFIMTTGAKTYPSGSFMSYTDANCENEEGTQVYPLVIAGSASEADALCGSLGDYEVYEGSIWVNSFYSCNEKMDF